MLLAVFFPQIRLTFHCAQENELAFLWDRECEKVCTGLKHKRSV